MSSDLNLGIYPLASANYTIDGFIFNIDTTAEATIKRCGCYDILADAGKLYITNTSGTITSKGISLRST